MIKTEAKYSEDCFHDGEELIGNKIFYKGLEVFTCPHVHYNLVQSVKKYLNPFSEIIELGSGSGALALRLKDENFNIVASGIEPDAFNLENINYYYIDLNKEIAEEHHEVYDGVVASEVIEHLENIFDFFRKIYMMLRPSGLAFITTPNILSVLVYNLRTCGSLSFKNRNFGGFSRAKRYQKPFLTTMDIACRIVLALSCSQAATTQIK